MSLPLTARGAMPANRWTIHEQAREAFDLAGEARATFDGIAMDAAVAFDIGLDERGGFTEVRTGGPGQQLADVYSRMKHGDLDAVNFFAGNLAATAMQTERFVALSQSAIRDGRVVYMTTTAEFNVPSGSNLLLKMTAGHVNVMLALRGMAPVVVAEQTRLSEGALGHASRTVRERRDALTVGRGFTIVPEHFRDQSVISSMICSVRGTRSAGRSNGYRMCRRRPGSFSSRRGWIPRRLTRQTARSKTA